METKSCGRISAECHQHTADNKLVRRSEGVVALVANAKLNLTSWLVLQLFAPVGIGQNHTTSELIFLSLDTFLAHSKM